MIGESVEVSDYKEKLNANIFNMIKIAKGNNANNIYFIKELSLLTLKNNWSFIFKQYHYIILFFSMQLFTGYKRLR